MEKVKCSKCVLHSDIPNVTIAENGVCSVCESAVVSDKTNEKISAYFSRKLNNLLDRIKQEKGKWTYDALVLFSGGKDSTYLLKLVKEKFGLRPLAFSVVHPLVNNVASTNMEDVAKKLDVELLKYYLTEEEYRKIIRHSLIEGYKVIKDECLGCNTCSFIFKNAAIMTAMRMNIPVVFDGADTDQSETPVYMDGEKMKLDAEKGIKPFGKLHDIAIESLGEKYKGSIYDFDYEILKGYNFPSFVSPFTFIDYNFKNNFKEFEELGLDSSNFKTVFTNCNAVPFFSYFSLKRYGCLTYIRHYANEIRKGYPYFLQSKLFQDENDGALSRETIEKLLEEYENAVMYVVDNNLDKNNITNDDEKHILSMAPTHRNIYGQEVCDIFLDQVLMVNPYGKFFDIDLLKI